MYTNECLYKDVYTIIEMMDDEMRNKINHNFVEFLKQNQDSKFEGTIDREIPIKKQILREEVTLMLSQMYIDFFCEEEERKQILEKENERVNEFYNRDFFKKKKDTEVKIEENNYPIVVKNNIWNKIKLIIKQFFRKS